MRTKRFFLAIICTLLCLGLLAGCGAQEPQGSGNEDAKALRMKLTGNWSQVTEDGSPSLPDIGIPSGYVFYLDGTGIDTFWDMTFAYTIDDTTLHIAYDDKLGEDWDYTYSIEGDILTLTRVDDDAVTMLYQREIEEETTTPEEETETEEESETKKKDSEKKKDSKKKKKKSNKKKKKSNNKEKESETEKEQP